MPWKVRCSVDLKMEFVIRSSRKEKPFGALCEEYGISRKTGYKWKKRYQAQGLSGLEEHSRKPRNSPNQLTEDVVCEVVRLKGAHLGWGPMKVREVYGRKHPRAHLPSLSAFKRILEKSGLVKKRKARSQETCGRIEHRIEPEFPNDLWTVDFKGWWHTRDGERCEPLTVRDAYSRFVLCAVPVDDATTETIQRHFEMLFERYGLPRFIRSDNGAPFASTSAPLGLSRLSAGWVALGIGLDRIPPGRPDQNGAHERMHRDIAAEVEAIPAADLPQQAAILETWRHCFNNERPHQALGMRTPSELYRPSAHPYQGYPEEIDYPKGFLRRKASAKGVIPIDGVKITVSIAIGGWHLGLEPHENQTYLVWFGPLSLGTIDITTEAFSAFEAVTIAKK